MVPHQVVEHPLGHPLGAEVASVQLLVAPLDPASLGGHTVDQAERIHLRNNTNQA